MTRSSPIREKPTCDSRPSTLTVPSNDESGNVTDESAGLEEESAGEGGEIESRSIAGERVRGLGVDAVTRCVHYDDDWDVIAIEFACCRAFYPCHACHAAVADHEPTLWPTSSFDERAVLCGVCGHHLSIRAYLDGNDSCPECGHAFNPGCKTHAHLYFDV